MHCEAPPKSPVRSSLILIVKYGFGDASGTGFGSTWQREGCNIYFWYGVLGGDLEDISSNYRELSNLVSSLEAMTETTSVERMEIFFFTNNSMAEGAFFKVSLSSKLLFDLILRFKLF